MKEVTETEAEMAAKKETRNYQIVERNSIAIAQTLTHHGKVMGELYEEFESYKREIAMLKQDLAQQRQMMVTALQTAYGHGSTA